MRNPRVRASEARVTGHLPRDLAAATPTLPRFSLPARWLSAPPRGRDHPKRRLSSLGLSPLGRATGGKRAGVESRDPKSTQARRCGDPPLAAGNG